MGEKTIHRPTPEEIARTDRAAIDRAAERAKAVLRPGHRLLVQRCGNSKGAMVTFKGWDQNMILTPTLDDVVPWCVLARNGQPCSFRDAPVNDPSREP